MNDNEEKELIPPNGAFAEMPVVIERKVIKKLSRKKMEDKPSEQGETVIAQEIENVVPVEEEKDCPFCSRKIPVVAEYCPYCGKSLSADRKGMPNRKLLFAAAVAVVLLAGILILMPIIKKVNSYRNALSLMNEGNFSGAIAAFRELEDYKDAQSYVTYCRALDNYQDGDLEKSEELFRSLADFEDAARYAEYVAGQKLITEGFVADNYEEAAECFLKAEGLLDSNPLNLYCEGIAAFLKEDRSAADKLQTAIAAEDLDPQYAAEAEAGLRFLSLKEQFDKDDYSCLAELQQMALGDSLLTAGKADDLVSYIKGKEFYAEERYYSAYSCLNNCRNIKDASELADSCFQERPASGIIYRNTSSGSVNVTIYDTADEEDMVVKIYDSSDELLEILYIRDGRSATAYFQSGSSRMAIATGDPEDWFGPKECFGPLGTYQRLLLDGNNEYYSFPGGGSYTLRFNVSSGNVDHKASSYGDF